MIRFAVWAAVSSIEQVDGVSLDNQIKKCKERGLAEKWQDTGLQYVADGYSRTGYIDLSKAEQNIPPLAKMLGDMRQGRFDVLLVWNYDRLGDLIVMVATDFRNNKRQLFSLSQPTPVQEIYNPYMADSSFIMQALAPIWQKQRIADLSRKWEAGMPKRVKDGLHPNHPPFGYKWISKTEPPEIIPAEIALVKSMATMLLEGHSLKGIARHCAKTGLKLKRGKWSHTAIINILENPYYVGVIEWPKRKRMSNKLLPVPLSARTVAKGRHEAVFTEDEFNSIVTELANRYKRNRKSQIYFPLSGLTYCGTCGEKMRRNVYHPGIRVLRDNRSASCKTYKYDAILKTIAEQIQAESLQRRNPKKVNPTLQENYDDEIKDIEQRIERVQQSAELGVYSPLQAAKRVSALQEELEKIARRKFEKEQAEKAQKDFSDLFEELEYMAEWIMTDDPAIVNRLLRSVIEKIIITDGKITINWLQG